MRINSAGAAAMRHSAVAVAEAVLVAAIVAALLLALSPVYQPADFLAGTETAQAAKGGNGGGGGGGKGGGGKPAPSSATLAVTPNPAAAGGSTYTVSGSGFGSSQMVAMSIANPGCCLAFNVLSSSTGTINFSATTGSPGTYVVKAYRYGTTTLLAQTSFVVQ